MKLAGIVLLSLAATVAAAQGGPERGHGPRWQQMHGPAAPPGGMSWEERQRLREELKDARRQGWREGWRGQQFDPRRGAHPPLPPEERERLRRDIHDANRDLQQRR